MRESSVLINPKENVVLRVICSEVRQAGNNVKVTMKLKWTSHYL